LIAVLGGRIAAHGVAVGPFDDVDRLSGEAGADQGVAIPRVDDAEWAADNKTIFYTVENPAKRQWRLYRHALGDPSANDALVYEEKDDLYDLYASRSRSGDWIFVTSESKTESEVRAISTHDPAAAPRVIVPRKADHKYFLDQRGDRFYILTNDAGINYRVASAPISDPQQKNWTEVIAYRKPVKIEDIDLFANHLVATEREGGLSQLEIVDLRDGKSHRIRFPEPAYALTPNQNHVFDTKVFRYSYQSLVTPLSVYDYDMESRSQTLLKRNEVPGGYDPNYHCQLAVGAGLMIAGFDPLANVSWVRALILYAILQVVYQIFSQIALGRFDIVAFIVAILVAVIILVLYPNKPALWMQGSSTMGGARA